MRHMNGVYARITGEAMRYQSLSGLIRAVSAADTATRVDASAQPATDGEIATAGTTARIGTNLADEVDTASASAESEWGQPSIDVSGPPGADSQSMLGASLAPAAIGDMRKHTGPTTAMSSSSATQECPILFMSILVSNPALPLIDPYRSTMRNPCANRSGVPSATGLSRMLNVHPPAHSSS